MNISMKLAYELFNAIELWKEFLEQWGKIVWDCLMCFASSWVSEFMCVKLNDSNYLIMEILIFKIYMTVYELMFKVIFNKYYLPLN